jgi:hypothetical protein
MVMPSILSTDVAKVWTTLNPKISEKRSAAIARRRNLFIGYPPFVVLVSLTGNNYNVKKNWDPFPELGMVPSLTHIDFKK